MEEIVEKHVAKEEIEKRRARAAKCLVSAAQCKERARELLVQAQSFDLESESLRCDANRLEALLIREPYLPVNTLARRTA